MDFFQICRIYLPGGSPGGIPAGAPGGGPGGAAGFIGIGIGMGTSSIFSTGSLTFLLSLSSSSSLWSRCDANVSSSLSLLESLSYIHTVIFLNFYSNNQCLLNLKKIGKDSQTY
jgi:hypothetical protein